ncbi:hypothetical protein [Trichormus azollae]|uniref:hypothetical protein n=1 Tax=Trichormus azollae TaxID=1164 RepID=UPI0016519DCB|nr:hypothetical protein [Trichormus azollae]
MAIAITNVFKITLAVRVNLAGVQAFLISIKSLVSGQLSVIIGQLLLVSCQELTQD